MIEIIKKYLVYIFGMVALCGFFFLHCNVVSPIKNVTTHDLGRITPTKEEIKTYNAKDVIKVIPVENKLGYKVETKIIETKDNKLIQVSEQKIDWGLRLRLGAYMDGSLLGMGGGGRINYFSVYKANLDAMVGFPRAGLGLSWQLYKNTSLGIAYSYNYNKLVTEPSLYLSMGF